jgi:hypothetical protein
MTDHDLLEEIHRVREKVARECGYDVHKIGERMRQREREEKARGVRYASFVQRRGVEAESCVVREVPGGNPEARRRIYDTRTALADCFPLPRSHSVKLLTVKVKVE